MTRGRRPYWRGIRASWYWVAFTALLLVSWYLNPPPGQTGPELVPEGVHQVRRVVDGDTLLLESGARVRLQGIDTPETVKQNYPVEPWGPEASQFTKRFVDEAGGRVRLTFGTERIDDYGRFLAFVWHDDVLLNEELVRAGLAHARLHYRYSGSMKRRFQRAEDEARSEHRGIWSNPPAAHAIP